MGKANEPTILFWGTAAFAVPALRAILADGYPVVGVITTPDKPVGRDQILTPSPVKECAIARGLSVYQPETLRPAGYALELPDANLFLVAAYGKIIPKEVLIRPRLGALNIHPSLLPRARGPSPIQYTILSGDTETGVTIIAMDELMDHGPIVAQRRLGTSIAAMAYPELHDLLAEEGAKLLSEVLPQWIRGEITAIPQDHTKATFSKILTKADGRIDWKKPAEEIERHIRAFVSWPGSWTMWPRNGREYRLRIDEAVLYEGSLPRGVPGSVFSGEGDSLCVLAGKGALSIRRLTIEGGVEMGGREFLRGRPTLIGSVLI